MNLNLSELQQEFLTKNPSLISSSEKYYRARNIGIFTISVTIFTHLINFIFFENIALGLGMVIVPFLIFVILYFTGSKNFYDDFDNSKGEYLQKLLDSMDDSSLKFIDSGVEMNYDEVEEVGFLQHNIHHSFRPIRRNYITGTYKNIMVKIGELDFKHQKNKSALLDSYWRPSTLLVFDYGDNYDTERISFYVRQSNAYRGFKNKSYATIHKLKKIVKLDGIKIKTNIKSIDNKYLTFSTQEDIPEKISNDEFKKSVVSFNKWNYKEKGVTRMTDAKFLTLYKGKIAILIFGQKFLEVRMDSIFEVYHEELKSILKLVDVFKGKNN